YPMSFLAFPASPGETAKVMLCSDDDWVIKITLICSLASMENNLPLNPALPTMPLPSRLRMLMLLIDDIPFIGKLDGLQSCRITVPSKPVSKVFLMTIGIFFKNAGIIVGG